jgi:hypothetical protein
MYSMQLLLHSIAITMVSFDSVKKPQGERVITEEQTALTLVVDQVRHAQHVARQVSFTLRNEENDENDENSMVYLCGHASEDSYVGPVDEEESITEEGVKDFIRGHNPDMFFRLFVEQDQLNKVHASKSCIGYEESMLTEMSPDTTASNERSGFSAISNNSELRDGLLRFKHLLVSFLLGSYTQFPRRRD